MPGNAKTDKFMLGTATVMIGPQADLLDLNPDQHSLGLVKNFQVTSAPQFTELRQGVKNNLVYSVMTENTVTASFEVFEYTARNLGYGLQLNGEDYSASLSAAVGALASAIDGTSTPVTDLPLGSGEGANFTVGDHIVIDAGDDLVVTREITAITVDSLTISPNIKLAIPAGASVKKVNSLAVGTKSDPDYFSLKAVGRAANGEAMVLLLPKIRITGGFTLAFQQDDFGNLPMEVTAYDKLASDPLYSRYANKQAELLRA